MTSFQTKQGSFEKNKPPKILECHSTYPLRKNLVPEILADPQIGVGALSAKILSFPSCFIFAMIAPLNSEKLDGFLSGPPFRLLKYFYWTFPVGEV